MQEYNISNFAEISEPLTLHLSILSCRGKWGRGSRENPRRYGGKVKAGGNKCSAALRGRFLKTASLQVILGPRRNDCEVELTHLSLRWLKAGWGAHLICIISLLKKASHRCAKYSKLAFKLSYNSFSIIRGENIHHQIKVIHLLCHLGAPCAGDVQDFDSELCQMKFMYDAFWLFMQILKQIFCWRIIKWGSDELCSHNQMSAFKVFHVTLTH